MTTRNQKRKATVMVSEEVLESPSSVFSRVESVELGDQTIRVASTLEGFVENSSKQELSKFNVDLRREILAEIKTLFAQTQKGINQVLQANNKENLVPVPETPINTAMKTCFTSYRVIRFEHEENCEISESRNKQNCRRLPPVMERQ